MNDAAGRWLEDLGGRADGSDLPIEIPALATRFRHLDASRPAMPRLRVRAGSGRWATLHASWMYSRGDTAIAVIIEEAAPAEVAPVIMSAYGLTDRVVTIEEASAAERLELFGRAFALSGREYELLGLLATGSDTRAMARQMSLSAHTIQDHLKSIFAKTEASDRITLLSRALGTRRTAVDTRGIG